MTVWVSHLFRFDDHSSHRLGKPNVLAFYLGVLKMRTKQKMSTQVIVITKGSFGTDKYICKQSINCFIYIEESIESYYLYTSLGVHTILLLLFFQFGLCVYIYNSAVLNELPLSTFHIRDIHHNTVIH